MKHFGYPLAAGCRGLKFVSLGDCTLGCAEIAFKGGEDFKAFWRLCVEWGCYCRVLLTSGALSAGGRVFGRLLGDFRKQKALFDCGFDFCTPFFGKFARFLAKNAVSRETYVFFWTRKLFCQKPIRRARGRGRFFGEKMWCGKIWKFKHVGFGALRRLVGCLGGAGHLRGAPFFCLSM